MADDDKSWLLKSQEDAGEEAREAIDNNNNDNDGDQED